ncbi:ferrochelatase, partial [Pedobacter sp.]
MAKKGILLVNLGTPDSPEVKDVRKYLDQFL